MQQVKCSDCGTAYDDNLPSCPGCGCPTPKNASLGNASVSTTDTGYSNECLIVKLAKAVFWIIIILGGILPFFVGFILAATISNDYGLISIIVIVCFPLTILFALIVKAIIMLYANISINLHEINMKIK